MIPITFVEDHTSFRQYLSDALENLPNGFKVYQYDDGLDFINRFPYEHYTPAIVLMDLRMNNMNGYETTAWIKKHYPLVPVLAFSDIGSAEVIVELTRCGASGYFSKADCYPPARLIEAMEQVMKGKTYFKEPDMYDFVVTRLAVPQKPLVEGAESLTERQWELVMYISLHKTYQEHADELYISPNTYKSRLKKVFKKLGMKSSKELYEWANEKGFNNK